MSDPTETSNVRFEDLNWDIITFIFKYLPLKDLFTLRCVSSSLKILTEDYLQTIPTLTFNKKTYGRLSDCFDILSNICRGLQSLTLTDCEWLEDVQLRNIFERNPKLTCVRLSNSNNVTSVALQPLILRCKNLEVLELSKCYFLTTGCLETLVLHQSNIRELDLSYCNSLSEGVLIILLKKFRKLTHLSLAHVTCVGDPVVLAIAKFSKNVRHLNLNGCINVTDRGIQALSSMSHHLESLMIRGCNSVTDFGLSALRARGTVHIDRPIGGGVPIYRPFPLVFPQV